MFQKGYISRERLCKIMGDQSLKNNSNKQIKSKKAETRKRNKSILIYIFDEGKEFMMICKGYTEAASKLNLNKVSIKYSCKHKTCLHGYYFSYNQFVDDVY